MPSWQTNLRRKKQAKAMPLSLVIVLLVIVFAFGGALGYIVRDRSWGTSKDIDQLKARIAELEGAPVGDEPQSTATDEPGIDQLDANDQLSGDGESSALSDAPFGDNMSELESQLTIPTEPVIVAEYEGGTVMSDEVLDEYNQVVGAYLLSGFSVSDNASELLAEVLSNIVEERIAKIKADELKLTELTQEDLAAIDAEANSTFDETIADCADYVYEDGMTDEQLRAASIQYLEQQDGITLESLKELIKESQWSDKLYDSVIADVKLTDEQLTQAYDKLVAEQKESFDAYPDDYEYEQLYGGLVAYNPVGYRTVKHIYFSFDGSEYARVIEILDELSELNADTDAEKIAALNTELDALYVPYQQQAQQALDRISAGESFDEVLADVGQDDVMQDGAGAEKGYYVSSNSSLWSESFVEASMGLQKAGDLSQIVRSESGVHIINYVGDVAAGAVPIDEIRTELEEETLISLQTAAYQAQMDAWLEVANVVYYPERLQ